MGGVQKISTTMSLVLPSESIFKRQLVCEKMSLQQVPSTCSFVFNVIFYNQFSQSTAGSFSFIDSGISTLTFAEQEHLALHYN